MCGCTRLGEIQMPMHQQVLNYKAHGKNISVNILQPGHLQELQQIYAIDQQQINIFASGSSISRLNFSEDLLAQPTIFVNGSIALSAKYDFKSKVAYVISDARFIEHAPQIFKTYYQAQPLFITQTVLEKILELDSHLIEQYQDHLYLIKPVDRPFHQPNASFLSKLFSKKKLKLVEIQDSEIVLDLHHDPVIGVSLNICKGFVEAGTVAYVATQLAYSLGAKNIYLYGMDLINTHQPRFYENQQNQAPCKLDKAVESRIVPSFDFLAAQYKHHNINVFNASDISKNLFEHLEYRSVF